MKEKEKPVWIPDHIHLPAKISAVTQGKQLKVWIQEAMIEKLQREEESACGKEK